MTLHKNSADRQLDIIQAAAHIIDGRGIHALTLKNISKELGLSDASLLRHYRNKEEIVEAMAQRVFFRTVVPEDFSQDLTVAENLTHLMEMQFQAFEAWPESTSIIFQEEVFREYPAVQSWFQERRRDRQRRIVAYLRTAQGKGSVSPELDPDIFALIFTGGMRLAVMEWREGGRLGGLAGKAKALVRTMSSGLEGR